MIACKPTFPAYLSCLLPTDQVFDFDELEYHFQVANRTEDMPSTDKKGIENVKYTLLIDIYFSMMWFHTTELSKLSILNSSHFGALVSSRTFNFPLFNNYFLNQK